MLTIDATMRARYWTTVRNEGRCTRRIANLADVILAVSDIYYHKTVLWGHAREGRGQHALTDKSPERANVDALLSEIGHRIWEYFNGGPNTTNTQGNFDEFHSDLCDYFLSKINAIREKVGYAPMSYGQAQKLINLTFKYLTCYADYETYADLFHYSHMVIDSNVLGSFSKSKLSALLGTPVTSVIKDKQSFLDLFLKKRLSKHRLGIPKSDWPLYRGQILYASRVLHLASRGRSRHELC